MPASKNSIPRVSRDEFKKDFIHQNRPMIITDALSHWRAHGLWTPQYLATNVNSRRVTVAVTDAPRIDGTQPSLMVDGIKCYVFPEMEFGEAVPLIEGKGPPEKLYFMMQQDLPAVFPELLADIKTPEWMDHPHPAPPQLWFGGAGNVTSLHFDLAHNFYAQIYGTKVFTILDPMQTEYLYPLPAESPVFHFSPVDVARPDLERFPKFRQAKSFQFTLYPGELLYLPVLWWHHVLTPTVAISVNFWWGARLQEFFVPNGMTALIQTYKTDRWKNVKARVLSEEKLGFYELGGFFLSRGYRRLAIFAASAALSELKGREDGPAFAGLARIDPVLLSLISRAEMEATDDYSDEDVKGLLDAVNSLTRLALA